MLFASPTYYSAFNKVSHFLQSYCHVKMFLVISYTKNKVTNILNEQTVHQIWKHPLAPKGWLMWYTMNPQRSADVVHCLGEKVKDVVYHQYIFVVQLSNFLLNWIHCILVHTNSSSLHMVISLCLCVIMSGSDLSSSDLPTFRG